MVDSIYIEAAVVGLPRTKNIVERYPKANQIQIERYGEVFNSHSQDFRIQKNNPSLILAAKQNKKVMPTPPQYETGGGAHYYFSHMLNCVYDCRYCFLQGMLRSANFLVFVNYDDFLNEIRELAEQHQNDDRPCWFFSGYDCDSLAYEPVTGFAEHFVPAFKDIPNAVLELRTKSTQIRSLLNQEAQENVVIADKRIEALQKLQQHGWRIGLRFDPIIWHENYKQDYANIIQKVFAALDAERIDSLTLGGFRLPKGYYKTMRKLHPEHWLFSAGLKEKDGMVTYASQIENSVLQTVGALCEEYMVSEKIFAYSSFENAASDDGLKRSLT